VASDLFTDIYIDLDVHDQMKPVQSEAYIKYLSENFDHIWEREIFNEDISSPVLVIIGLMNRAIAQVSPFLDLVERAIINRHGAVVPNWEWRFNSLLSMIYLMVFLEWNKGLAMRRCANPLCGQYLMASREATRYCSDQCQNRAKQQRYKQRKKISIEKRQY
jgi:hypothetical protein